MSPLEWIKLVVAAVLTLEFANYARSGKVKRHLTVFVGWSWRQWATSFSLVALEVAVVLGLVMFLVSLGSPLLNFSWLLLFATPADGPQPSTNLISAGTSIPWVGIGFGVLLALNIPRLARIEEEVFRRGTTDMKDALVRSTKFGFIHMVVGVPVAGAMSLILAGLFFTWRYKRGGVRDATFHHSLHNLIILGIIAFFTLRS